MPIATLQPESLTVRPLAVRRRTDLVSAPQVVAGRRYWAVKDPVSMAYFRLSEEEQAVLEMLDGRAGVAEIIARFEHRFAPRRLTPEHLQAFLARLHADGLILSDGWGQGGQLLERGATQRRRRRTAAWANPLAIRFPGVNPTPILNLLYPLARGLFSPLAVALCVALIVAAAALAATHWPQVVARLPDFDAFVTPRNAVLLLVAVSLTKILHELGHALACRHLGGECHELGPMLLFFAPCLYCNVSDSWMFSGKWRRIIVAGAGIYVEAVLAAAATFVWWWSAPGLTNALCLNIMSVCSIGTLLFNGNPLMRYDGYYVLSDLVEIPNLAERSVAALRALVARLALGVQSPVDRDYQHLAPWRRAFLIAYGIASIVYRFVIVGLLLWFCYRVLRPYRLEMLAELLAVVVVGGMLAGPLARGVSFARTPSVAPKVRRGRALVSLAVVVAAAAAIAAVPLPVHVTAPVVVEPQDARRVYVSEPGILVSSIRAGEVVTAGQTLATLRNSDLELEINQLTGDRDRQQLRLKHLELRRSQDPQAAAEIPTAREALADFDERLRARRADAERLTLAAPGAGTVLPPQWKTAPRQVGQLPGWQGIPLSEHNQGAFLEQGTIFCLVGDPERLEAVAVVDQADVERLRVGQRCQLKLDQAADEILPGAVSEIAEIDVEVAPRELAYGGELAVRKDESGLAHPATASYQVRIALDEHRCKLLPGSRGRTRITADSESLLDRCYRWLRGTFHFAA